MQEQALVGSCTVEGWRRTEVGQGSGKLPSVGTSPVYFEGIDQTEWRDTEQERQGPGIRPQAYWRGILQEDYARRHESLPLAGHASEEGV